MAKVKKTLLNILNEVKGYGFTSLLALAGSLFFWFQGNNFLFAFLLGVFVTTNWEVFRAIWNEKVMKTS